MEKEIQNEETIIERYTKEGKFNLSEALITQDRIIKNLSERVIALEEAMMFFSNWYNKTQETNILVPEHLKKDIYGSTTSIID